MRKKKCIIISLSLVAVLVATTILIICLNLRDEDKGKRYLAPNPIEYSKWETNYTCNDVCDIYVSTTGSDSNDGSLEHPFLTIEHAKSVVSAMDKTKNEIKIGIKPGNYNVKNLYFGVADAGNENCLIRYIALRDADEKVVFNSGTVLNSQNFVDVSNYPQYESRLTNNAKQNVKVLDLKQSPYNLTKTDWGKITPIGVYSTCRWYNDNSDGPMYAELFVNSKRQNIARYPNNGFLKTGEVVRSGKDTRDADLTPENLVGDVYKIGSLLCERINSWANLQEVWVHGCFKYDWADSSSLIEKVDSNAKELHIKHQSFYGAKEGTPYYFYNCLEELDCPNEYYIDRENGLLLVYAGDDFNSSTFELSTGSGTIININTNYISFEGITFEGNKDQAIVGTGNHITIKHCLVQDVGGNGINLNGNYNLIEHNELREIGRGGISIKGGDTATLTNSNSVVNNNLVHDWAQVYKMSQDGIHAEGVGCKVSNNEVYNSPHTGISFAGNNNIVEYNSIHDVLKESDDSGAIYAGRSWVWYGNEVRYNLIYNLGSENHNPHGIYLDDALSGEKVYGNVLINVPSLAIIIGGGRDNYVADNIIVNAGWNAIFYDARAREGVIDETFWFSHSRDGDCLWRDLYNSPYLSDTWQEAFPQYSNYSNDINDLESPNFAPNPANSVIKNNLIFDDEGSIGDIAAEVYRFSTVKDNYVYGLDKMKDIFMDFENGDYRIKDGEILTLIPGLSDIILENIGRD